MKLKNLSSKMQFFLASLLICTIPITLTGIITANRNASAIVSEYKASRETIISQSCLTIDTLLSDATKIAYLPLLSSTMQKAMVRNYGSDYLAYAQDSDTFREQFTQANRLNQHLTSCVFVNKYGYTFEYNIISAIHQRNITQNIEDWADLARASQSYTYFGPIQPSASVSQKNVLPVLKIILDGTTFQEIGVCYMEINSVSVENILFSAQNNNSAILVYNSDGDLIYTSAFSQYPDFESDKEMMDAFSAFSQELPDDNTPQTRTIHVGSKTYLANGCRNLTTGWHLIQFSDDHAITALYRNNLLNQSGILLFSLILGLILSIVLSRKLTSSISLLCEEIDHRDANQYTPISVEACGSNQELVKLVCSFNSLNRRLADSLESNYQIRLQEQQTRIQMLQFQINHHFLHNTLNTIKALADLHNVPEIETIAVCMSDLIRYNMTKFPTALLSEELAQVHRYMTIQNIRFSGKFTLDCCVPEQFCDIAIPAFILQPFVENCVNHGFSQKESNCLISISGHLEHGTLHLLVADNGCGIPPRTLTQLLELLEHPTSTATQVHSLGIQNVHQRIQSTYGKAYGVLIESQAGQGTLVDISIPFDRCGSSPL